MSVTVRGRVPSQWNDQTVAHLTERLRALETAVAGGKGSFTSPAAPPFGPGAGVVVVSAPGGGVSGGVTDHGALTGLADNDHPQYLARHEAAQSLPHSHRAEDVSGLEQTRRPPLPHSHTTADVADFDPWQQILMTRIFGG